MVLLKSETLVRVSLEQYLFRPYTISNSTALVVLKIYYIDLSYFLNEISAIQYLNKFEIFQLLLFRIFRKGQEILEEIIQL